MTTILTKLTKYFFMIALILFGIIFLIITKNLYSVNYPNKLDVYLPQNLYSKKSINPWAQSLKLFWLQTNLDPILALPGVNLSELEAATAKLPDSQNQVLTFYSQEDQKLIEDLLHPYDFLQSLTKTEKSRREFILEPSLWRAVKYQHHLSQSLNLLHTYQKKLSDLFLTFNLDHDLWYFAGITRDKYVALQLSNSYQESQKQLAISQSRLWCLLGAKPHHQCHINLPNTIVPIHTTITPSDQTDTNIYANILRSYLNKYKSGLVSLTRENITNIPLIHLNKSACTQSDSATYLLTWRSSRNSGLPGLWITTANEVIFHDLQKRRNDLHTAMADLGASYEFQPFNQYLCIDGSLDVGQIRTAYYLYNDLKSQPLFLANTISEENSDIAKISELEKIIIDSTAIIDIDDIENYILYIQRMVYNEPELLKQNLGETSFMRTMDIITIWRSQSGWLESEISRLDDLAVTTEGTLKNIPIELKLLFTTRSYFSTTLLSGNMTLYEQPLSFLFERRDLDLAEVGLTLLPEVMDKLQIDITDMPEYINSQDLLTNEVYHK